MRRVTLEVAVTNEVKGSRQGTLALTWIFPNQTLVVGRSKEESDLALEHDGSISKRHFEISFDGDVCRLRDLQTTNGTYVNDVRVEEAVLKSGDRIEAGKTQFALGIVDMPPSFGEEVDIEGTVRADTAIGPASPVETGDELAGPPTSSPDMLRASQVDFGFVTLAVVTGPCAVAPRNDMSKQLVWIRAGQRIKVGRSVWDADWVIPSDPMISGLHFEVVFDGKNCRIKDLNSSNGTFVNGDPVETAPLSSGDRIQAGETTFELHFS